MAYIVEFFGNYYEEIKESEKDFLGELEKLKQDGQDSIIRKRMEEYFKSKGIELSNLSFYEGAHHVAWRKEEDDYFVIQRHWTKD